MDEESEDEAEPTEAVQFICRQNSQPVERHYLGLMNVRVHIAKHYIGSMNV